MENKYLCFLLFALVYASSCNSTEQKNKSETITTELPNALFANAKNARDTVVLGEKVVAKIFLSDTLYKENYYRSRGLFRILRNGFEGSASSKQSDYILFDSLNIKEDTSVYILNTIDLKDLNKGDTNVYYYESTIFLKNRKTNKDTIYFAVTKKFVVIPPPSAEVTSVLIILKELSSALTS